MINYRKIVLLVCLLTFSPSHAFGGFTTTFGVSTDQAILQTLLEMPIRQRHLDMIKLLEEKFKDNPHFRDLKGEVEFALSRRDIDHIKSQSRYKQSLVNFLASITKDRDEAVLDEYEMRQIKMKTALGFLSSTILQVQRDKHLEYFMSLTEEYDGIIKDYLVETGERLYEYWESQELDKYTDEVIKLWQFVDYHGLGANVRAYSYPVK